MYLTNRESVQPGSREASTDHQGGLSAKYSSGGPLLGDTQSHRSFLYVLNARWRQPRWWFGTKRPVLHESTATAKAQHQPSIRTTGCAERAQQHQTSTKPRVCKQGDTGRGSDSIRLPDRTRWRLSCTPRATSQGQDRSLTATSDPATGAWIAGPSRIPKLTVRVRFPSPAPHAKSVAAQANREPSQEHHSRWRPYSGSMTA